MRKLISLLFVSIVFTSLSAQINKNSILLTINNEPVTVGEFERIYTKNNQEASFDKASLDEYMELFVNFKLKVIEAESQGLDTLKTFKQELKGYKYQLEKPYLTDPKIDSILIQEAYGRMAYLVKASHILIKCPIDALPSDTLAAYNKIKDIRNRIVNKNVNFAKLAKQYSDDTYTAVKGGELGYFSAFAMVYKFESAAFNTKVGEVSDITKTRFGYHIVKVLDKKENPGEVHVAHLMRSTPRGSTQEKIDLEREYIFKVYDSIMSGAATFEEMVVKHSDDKGSSRNNGELKPFGYGRMVPEFEKTAFALESIGDISEPVQTAYGWHIVKLLGINKVGTLEESSEYIKGKISKDVRASKGRSNLINSLKKEYNFTENRKTIDPFYTLIDSSFYSKEWNVEKANGLKDVMFTLADTIDFTQKDFANFLNEQQQKRSKMPLRLVVDRNYTAFVEKEIFDFEKSRLEEKYPDFKHLLKEYHDGILLFNLSDKMVWSKAIKDTLGLKTFYDNNKNKYMWPERVEATTYTFNKSDYVSDIIKLANKVGKKNGDVQKALLKLNSKIAKNDSIFTISFSKEKFVKEDNQLVDSLGWEPGVKPMITKSENNYIIVYVNGKVGPEGKLLSEAKGHITADYQTFLEKEWIDQLRKKYAVEINQEVLEGLIK